MNIVPAGTEPLKCSILERGTGKGEKGTQTGKARWKCHKTPKQALRMLLSHLELFARGNGRESKVVLVPSQKIPKDISSHTGTKTHMCISRSLS